MHRCALSGHREAVKEKITLLHLAPVRYGKCRKYGVNPDPMASTKNTTIESLNQRIKKLGDALAECKAELRAASEREHHFRRIIDSSEDLIFIIDRKFSVRFANSAGGVIFGTSADKIIGKTLDELFPPQIAARHKRSLKRIFESGKPEIIENLTSFPGRDMWLDTRLFPIAGKKNKIEAVLGFSRDITKRKLAEESLAESEERYRAFSQATLEGIILHANGKIIDINESLLQMTGFKREEAVGRDMMDFIPAGEQPIVLEKIITRNEHPYDTKIKRRDGSSLDVEACGKTMEHRGRTIRVGAVRDITERKKAEAALRESEERYRMLIETMNDGFIVLDERHLVSYINKRLCEMVGYDADEMLGRSLEDFISTSNVKLFKSQMERRRRGDMSQYELEWVRKDGTPLSTLVSPRSIMDEAGIFRGSFGVVTDITARKRMEAELSREIELLGVTLRSIGDGVIATDLDSRIFLMNNVAENLTGWRYSDAVDRDINEVFNIIDERTHIRKEVPVEKVLRRGRIINLENSTVLISRDGTMRNISDSGAPIRDNRGKIIGVVLVFRDTTKERMVQDELFKAKKIESIGVLAGGIAHDFNNLLTAILGNINLARHYSGSPEQIGEMLADAETAALRAQNLTQQLLTFSKGGAPVIKTAPVDKVIVESADFACSGSNVHCVYGFAHDLRSVLIDEGQISQVIQNLVINSKEAMPTGGTIFISCENMSPPFEETLPDPDRNYIKITIRDQGIGILPEHIQRIFDPYFTTKDRGSGLGLSITYSIIKNHNGHIRVDSERGKGTTFSIFLPAAEPSGETAETDPKDAPPQKGSGRILLMDDEETVRKTTGQMLRHLGYEVVTASDVEDAVGKFTRAQDEGSPFIAVILDLTMQGGIGGIECVRKLLLIDPGVRTLVSSGYSNDPVMTDFRKYGFSGVITKPYKVEELGRVLHEMIHSSS